MIREKTVYITNDDKEYTTEEKAKEHICNVVAELLDKKITEHISSRKESFKAILSICGSYEKLIEFYDQIGNIIG